MAIEAVAMRQNPAMKRRARALTLDRLMQGT
jgi:hypothetical protein